MDIDTAVYLIEEIDKQLESMLASASASTAGRSDYNHGVFNGLVLARDLINADLPVHEIRPRIHFWPKEF